MNVHKRRCGLRTEMTSEQRYICNQQQEFYEYMQAHGVDLVRFSDCFLHSDFCNGNIDKPYSVYQFSDVTVDWADFFDLEGCLVDC